MRSGRARCGDIELYYEDLGDLDAPAVMLIMGVGAQLPMWPDGFCAQLVTRGYRVIRFDHRDTGLSTKMHGMRAEGSVYRRAGRYLLGRASSVPYTLVDLAEDVRALLDYLDIGRAHVVGASMGGMIAQVLAGAYRDRVRSLAVIMSGSGKPFSSIPRWRLLRLPFQAPGRHAPWEERLAYEVRNIRLFNGPNFLPPDDELRRRVTELTARCDYPQGMLRQFDAILGTGSLGKYARKITAPTVIIHGSADPLVRPRNGRGVARVIGHARFVMIDGMGHDLPEPVWEPIIDAIVENSAAAH